MMATLRMSFRFIRTNLSKGNASGRMAEAGKVSIIENTRE